MRFIFRKITTLLACSAFSTFACGQESRHITIKGIDGDVLQSAMYAISDTDNKESCDSQSPTDAAFVSCAENSIRELLKPYGYFKPTITAQFLNMQQTNTIAFDVHQGPALRYSAIDITITGDGRNNKQLVAFKSTFPLKVHDRFIADDYVNAKTDFFRVANNQGYIKATFDRSEVSIDLHKYTAKIILHLNTGKQYYYGKTTFTSSPYADSFLRRFITYKQGEPISNQALMDMQTRMSDSFYFQHASITPEINHIQQYDVPISIDATPPKSQGYSAAIGYGTFTGPRLTLNAGFRRLTDTGQHADIKIRASSILTGISTKYYIAGKNPLDDKWVIGADYQRFIPKNGKSFSNTLYGGYIKQRGLLFQNLTLNYLSERYTTENYPYHHSQLLYPSLNVAYKQADNVIRPTAGKSINIILKGASDTIFSTTSFAQADITGRLIFSPTSFSRLLLRAEFGYTIAEDLAYLPLSMRFFAGGLDSIRGYPDSSIGPGRFLEIANLEYQNKIAGNWWAAAFYDIGTATNHFGTPLNSGVGGGIIYESFIGPVKFYLANAISKPDRPWSVEFSIGPEF